MPDPQNISIKPLTFDEVFESLQDSNDGIKSDPPDRDINREYIEDMKRSDPNLIQSTLVIGRTRFYDHSPRILQRDYSKKDSSN